MAALLQGVPWVGQGHKCCSVEVRADAEERKGRAQSQDGRCATYPNASLSGRRGGECTSVRLMSAGKHTGGGLCESGPLLFDTRRWVSER